VFSPIRLTTLFLFVAFSILNDNVVVAAGEAGWQAGTARAVITPDGPYWMGGYASRNRPSEGTAQDLYAKALAVQDAGGQRFVIVTLDLLVVTRDIADAVASEVRQRFGLPRSALLLNCSHTHCGPELRLYREEVHEIPKEYAQNMHDYVASLKQKLIQLVGDSLEGLRPADLMASQSSASFAINRRNNRGEEVIAERSRAGMLEGPVDHAVPVLRISDTDGHTFAVLFGYACHNTTLSHFLTGGDYAGRAQAYLEQDHPGVTAMFVAGAGGDQNPWPRRQVHYELQHGRSLADAVNRALSGPQLPVSGALRVALRPAQLEFQPHAARQELLGQLSGDNRYARWKANYILRELDAGRQLPRTYKLPVQAARFGDQLLLVAIGGESVVDYSLRVKRDYASFGGETDSPAPPVVWVAGYSNDVFGYLPSLRVLREGGYEGGAHMVYTKFPGPFTETVEERIFAAIHELMKEVEIARP